MCSSRDVHNTRLEKVCEDTHQRTIMDLHKYMPIRKVLFSAVTFSQNIYILSYGFIIRMATATRMVARASINNMPPTRSVV
jgi:hypothetical protein